MWGAEIHLTSEFISNEPFRPPAFHKGGSGPNPKEKGKTMGAFTVWGNGKNWSKDA